MEVAAELGDRPHWPLSRAVSMGVPPRTNGHCRVFWAGCVQSLDPDLGATLVPCQRQELKGPDQPSDEMQCQPRRFRFQRGRLVCSLLVAAQDCRSELQPSCCVLKPSHPSSQPRQFLPRGAFMRGLGELDLRTQLCSCFTVRPTLWPTAGSQVRVEALLQSAFSRNARGNGGG